MDVEGYVRRRLSAGDGSNDVIRGLTERILEIKGDRITKKYAELFAMAVVDEVVNTSGLCGDFFALEKAGVTMGEFGVGSRGTGDFYAHRRIGKVITAGTPGGRIGAAVAVGVDEMDDAGAIRINAGRELFVVSTVDGMHSRLSDFPFLAGFHVTRATLRDVYVMGARPISMFSDIHVADDGDVGKIFDYTAGVTAVGDAMGVPLVTGSTLRIGGDMVLGDRMTGCVGAVGIAERLTPRRAMQAGDVLLMTEGAGGGTVATTALYYGMPEVVEETINLHFLRAAEALLASPALQDIHAMTDVTNGGLRGDAHEMAQTAQCRVRVEEEKVRGLVNPKVATMLENLAIDYLGVSIDALLLTAPADAAEGIRHVIGNAGVRIAEIGTVEKGTPEAVLMVDGKETDFSPRFRESAYTPVKKVVESSGRTLEDMKGGVDRAAEAAIAKKMRVLERLKKG